MGPLPVHGSQLAPGGMKYGQRQQVARGWFMNPHSLMVTYGCSDGSTHSTEGDITSTQRMGRMYRTEIEALRAMRHEVVDRVSRELAKIDARIDRASGVDAP